MSVQNESTDKVFLYLKTNVDKIKISIFFKLKTEDLGSIHWQIHLVLQKRK